KGPKSRASRPPNRVVGERGTRPGTRGKVSEKLQGERRFRGGVSGEEAHGEQWVKEGGSEAAVGKHGRARGDHKGKVRSRKRKGSGHGSLRQCISFQDEGKGSIP
ncbi:unnamed protein product, partial [Discosporangium mesarthrocarpum]